MIWLALIAMSLVAWRQYRKYLFMRAAYAQLVVWVEFRFSQVLDSTRYTASERWEHIQQEEGLEHQNLEYFLRAEKGIEDIDNCIDDNIRFWVRDMSKYRRAQERMFARHGVPPIHDHDSSNVYFGGRWW